MGIRNILKNLEEGKYDGARIENYNNGVSWGFFIHNGIPTQYREGKGGKYFNGKENVTVNGKYTQKKFETSAEKKRFFQNYGYLRSMFDKYPEVIEYSKAYYEKKDKK